MRHGMRRTVLCLAVLAGLALPANAWAVPAAVTRGPGPFSPQLSAARLPEPVACPGCYEPALRTSWQWQLQGPIDTSIEVDLYDVDGFEVAKRVVTSLHEEGRHVVCYLSAGSWENWRPDAGRFPHRVLGRANGWPGERWLDVRKLGVLGPIMKSRLDRCARKGFDAVEFDNADGFANRTGFPLTGSDQLRYDIFLANQAHRRGLSAVLKNDLQQVRKLLPCRTGAA